jgi:N4-gp56 family major capsid protein
VAYAQSDFNKSTDVDTLLGNGIVIPAYDKLLKWALTDKVLWRQFIDVHPVDPTNNSNVVHLKKNKYLTTSAPVALSEVLPADVTASPEPDDVAVTLAEYGKTMGRTTFLGDVAYVPVDPILAEQIAEDLAKSLDLLARAQFVGGTNRATVDGAAIGAGTGTGLDASPVNVNTLTAADVISAAAIRRQVKALRKRNVTPWMGDHYMAVISHETSLDIQEGADSPVNWQDPHIRVDTEAIYNGYVGKFAGAVFIESNRAYAATDGASSAAVHRTVFFGREAVVEAVKREPAVGVSPVTDPMNRHRGIYWYGSLGHAIFRQEALQRLEHGVSSNEV